MVHAGTAGGKKYEARSIVFKVTDDPKVGPSFLYGGQSGPALELAAKAAAHDLRSATAYLQAETRLREQRQRRTPASASSTESKESAQSRKPLAIHVPIMTVVDYLGFRLIAVRLGGVDPLVSTLPHLSSFCP